MSRRSQLDSFAEYHAFQVFAQEVLAKATSVLDATDGLRTVIAKATQLQDKAELKASNVNAEVSKFEDRVKLSVQNIAASQDYNVELGIRQATRLAEQ